MTIAPSPDQFHEMQIVGNQRLADTSGQVILDCPLECVAEVVADILGI